MVVLAGAPGCRLGGLRILAPGIPGDGVIAQEARELPRFNAIRVSDAIELAYQPAEVVRIVVEGDSNLLSLVQTDVRDGWLDIGIAPNRSISPSRPIRVRVEGPPVVALRAEGASRLDATLDKAPAPSEISASGASRLRVENLAGSDLAVNAEGASQVAISGRVETLVLDASGASRVEAGALDAGAVRLDVSGASTAVVRARERVEGDASGASGVRLVGAPAMESIATSGASGVARVPAGAAAR